MLALAGAAYQGVFRNPLADPYLLGAAAGAGLGATLAIAYGPDTAGWPVDLLPLAAFAGAVTGVVAAYALGRSGAAEDHHHPDPLRGRRRRLPHRHPDLSCSSGRTRPCGRCTAGSSAA